MKNVLIFFSFLLFVCLLNSCSKDVDPITKQDVFDLLDSKDDIRYIQNIKGVDFESAISSLLSHDEIEDFFVRAIHKMNYPDRMKGDMFERLLYSFKSENGIHLSECDDVMMKERFFQKYTNDILEIKKAESLRNADYCDWPDLECTDFPSGDPLCPTQPDWIFYREFPTTANDIMRNDCVKQGDDDEHNDCDYGYLWMPTQDVYDNPRLYELRWFCQNGLYRFWMDDGISGYREDIVEEPWFGSFLGVAHITFMYSFYIGACEQDQFVSDTHFDAVLRNDEPYDPNSDIIHD